MRSWLCELAERALRAGGQRPRRASRGYVEDSGEGRWTIEDAIDQRVPTPVITASLYARFYSRGEDDYARPVLAALRNQFGGHAVRSGRPEAQQWTHAEYAGASPRRTRSSRGSSGCPVHPTTLVIFGATGDLAHRKLLPAIYNLAHEGALPERFNLIGVSRREMPDDEFRDVAARGDPASTRAATPDDAGARRRCSSTCATSPGSFDDADGYERLERRARARSTRRPASALNRVFYLSTAPEFFPVIVEQLGDAGLQPATSERRRARA